MSFATVSAATRPPQVPPIPAGSGDTVHGSVFSGIYNPWTAPSTNFANVSTANAVRGMVNGNRGLNLASNPSQLAFGFPRDLATQQRNNWYSPWLGYPNNSYPGFVSPYVIQEGVGLNRCIAAPTHAGCRACVAANGGSPVAANRICNQDVYPGHYYRGYGDYYGNPGYGGNLGYGGNFGYSGNPGYGGNFGYPGYPGY